MKSHDIPMKSHFFGLKSPMKCSLLSWIWPPLVPLGASSGFLNWRTEHCLGPGTSAKSQRDLSGRGGLELVKGIHRGFSPIRCWESTSVFLGGLKAQRLKDHKNTTSGSFGCYCTSCHNYSKPKKDRTITVIWNPFPIYLFQGYKITML